MNAATSKVSALQTKLAAAVALVASLEAQIKAADLPLPVKGDNVGFTFGRGDKKVEYIGRVIATNDGDNGVTYVSVLVNEDTLPEIKRVPAKDVTVAPVHDSDCSLHNEPAMSAEPCDCSVSDQPAAPVVERDAHAQAVADLLGE